MTLAIGNLAGVVGYSCFPRSKEPGKLDKSRGRRRAKKKSRLAERTFRRSPVAAKHDRGHDPGLDRRHRTVGNWFFQRRSEPDRCFRKIYETRRNVQNGEAEKDRQFILMILGCGPDRRTKFIPKIQSKNLLSENAGQRDCVGKFMTRFLI